MKFGPKQISDDIKISSPTLGIDDISLDSFPICESNPKKINSDWLCSLTKEIARKFKSLILTRSFPSKNFSNFTKFMKNILKCWSC